MTARLDNGYQIDYGVRADDPAFRELQQGLSMLAAVPYGSIPNDAYAAWQDEAVKHISAGFQGTIDASRPSSASSSRWWPMRRTGTTP